jgi:hypothetical protein
MASVDGTRPLSTDGSRFGGMEVATTLQLMVMFKKAGYTVDGFERFDIQRFTRLFERLEPLQPLNLLNLLNALNLLNR